MIQNFAVKVKFLKVNEENPEQLKKASEVFLVSAITHGEVEEKVTEQLADNYKEMSIERISPKHFEKVFSVENGNELGKFWEITTRSQDTESEKIKLINSRYLVGESKLEKAIESLHEGLRGTILDYEISAISQSNIIEVIQD